MGDGSNLKPSRDVSLLPVSALSADCKFKDITLKAFFPNKLCNSVRDLTDTTKMKGQI